MNKYRKKQLKDSAKCYSNCKTLEENLMNRYNPPLTTMQKEQLQQMDDLTINSQIHDER